MALKVGFGLRKPFSSKVHCDPKMLLSWPGGNKGWLLLPAEPVHHLPLTLLICTMADALSAPQKGNRCPFKASAALSITTL